MHQMVADIFTQEEVQEKHQRTFCTKGCLTVCCVFFKLDHLIKRPDTTVTAAEQQQVTPQWTDANTNNRSPSDLMKKITEDITKEHICLFV